MRRPGDTMTTKPAGVAAPGNQPGWSETERLVTLRSYAILDSEPEQLSMSSSSWQPRSVRRPSR